MTAKATEIEIEVLDLLFPQQLEIATHPARFRVLCAGRRFGKTRLGAVVTVAEAVEGGKVWWVAPSFPMAQIGWRMIKSLAWQMMPYAKINESERIAAFAGGGSIQVKSADNPNSLRGEGLDLVVFDEAAFISEEAFTEAIRPALSDRKGRAVFISTPALRNWFFHLYRRGLGDDPEWQSWHLPTSANPYIDPLEIEAAREQLTEDIFRQEYLAEFRENSGAVFRNIEASLVKPNAADSARKHELHTVVCGVDFAQINDFTAISVFCADCSRELELDRFNQINWELQLGRIIAISQKWHVNDLVVESNSIGSPLLELLSQQIEVRGFETTAVSKPPLIQSLALAFEREEAHWLDYPWATEELRAFEVELNTHTGRPHYGAPVGEHDDTVIARAIALWAAFHPAGLFHVSTFER